MQSNKKLIYSNSFLAKAFVLLLAFFVFSCKKTDNESTNWKLVWSDEFEGEEGTALDASKWTYDIGGWGWGNNERQYYTDRTENASLDGDGNLQIVAREENYESSNYTSARILTQNTFTQQHGRFEARIKLPRGQGIWPAFWMLGANFPTVGWPTCGEIDIMEYLGNDVKTIHGSVHGPGYSAGNAVSSSYTVENARFDNKFYVFAVEWSSSAIKYYVDDNLYQTITPSQTNGTWVFNNEFFMILNVAVGGNWPGYPDESTRFPQTMYVDYVRVYVEND